MRTEFDLNDLTTDETYRLLTASVIPRPIAWVATRSASGVDNLAPHSFFTIASVDPPIVQFTSVGTKDSLRNVRETGEFVVNLASQELARQVNETATDFPPETSEFDAATIEREASAMVRPARVARSPLVLECRLHSEVSFGASVVVFGEVVRIAVRTQVLTQVDGHQHPDPTLLAPMARLGQNQWSALGELVDLEREPLSVREQRLRARPPAQ